MGTAICVVGTICSGKTATASRISETIGYPLLTETMFEDGLLDMLTHIGDQDSVVIEHCEILEHLARIEDHYRSVILVHLDIADELVHAHKEARVRRGATGGFFSKSTRSR